MDRTTETRRHVEFEVESLEPFEFVAVGPAGRAFNMIEVCRDEGTALELRVPGRPPLIPALSPRERASLRDHGFASEQPDNQAIPWTRAAENAAEAIKIVRIVIHQIFEEKPDIRYDLIHGSHRAEHDAKLKLGEVRGHVERVIQEVTNVVPLQDDEGDYLMALGDVQVVVAPRSVPNGPTLVRVFAVTNVGVTVTSDLGMMLTRLNFSLMFGRFTLDPDRRVILFDETLLGDPLNQEALRFAIKIVSTTADEWDDRLKEMFGGSTYQEILEGQGNHEKPPAKPGQSAGPQAEHGMYL